MFFVSDLLIFSRLCRSLLHTHTHTTRAHTQALDYNHPVAQGQPTDSICQSWREQKTISENCEIPVRVYEVLLGPVARAFLTPNFSIRRLSNTSLHRFPLFAPVSTRSPHLTSPSPPF